MRIAALEGPSFAGKTSALLALPLLLSASSLITYCCYVDGLLNVDEVPPARTRSALQQLEAFKVFMQIEAKRVADLQKRANQPDLVVLDRSVDTLLAHAYALDQLYSYGVHERARSLLAEVPFLCPDQTFYLDARPEVLRLRRERLEGSFDSFLLDSEFLGHFRSYFLHPRLPVSKQIDVVIAEGDQLAVVEQIARMLSRSEQM